MNQILRFIFKLYLFSLPLMLLPGLTHIRDIFSPNASIENGFFIVMLGVPLLFLAHRGKIPYFKNALYIKGIKLCLFLAIISFFTSLILYVPFGTLHGENTLKASFPSIVYLLLTAITFYFNNYLFRYIDKKSIRKIFDFLVVFEIIMGIIQVAVIKLPFLGGVYNIFSWIGLSVPSSFLLETGRVCLTTSEPAAAGIIVGVFFLPYVLSMFLMRKGIKYALYAFLFMALTFFTYSSTAYIGILVNIFAFTVLYIKKNHNNSMLNKGIIFFSFIILILLFSGNYIWNNTTFGLKLNELLLSKTTSQENLSTLSRYSTVYADWDAFLHYPITGVGNGNQGYFYDAAVDEHIPAFALVFEEFYQRMSGQVGIVNGGSFLPAYVSGYGIVGVILLIIFIYKCVKYIRNNEDDYDGFQYMYYIGGIAFLGLSMVSAGLDGNFVNMFIISIPFMQISKKEIR